MDRRPGWEARLAATVEAFRGRAFAWGVNDCCVFTGACVEALTGQNPAADYAGRYRNREEARRVLKEAGPGGLFGLLSRRFGPPVPPHAARRGDLVVAIGEGGASIGVCLGGYAAFVGEAFGQGGLVTLPLRDTLRAFRI